jgi:hypothetical protein
MNVLKDQYGRQLGMEIPVAIIGIILAMAIPC